MKKNRVRKGEEGKKRKKEKKWEKTKKVCFHFGIMCIFYSQGFGMNFPWMISCSFPRVLLGDYPNPRFVEFMWVKP